MIVIVLPDLPTEYDLLEQASRGDQDALRQIYVAYFTPIYQFIRIRVGDTQMAEDLASEVFLDFVGAVKGRNAGPRQNLRGWLFRVALNEALMARRRRAAGERARQRLAGRGPSPVESPETALARAETVAAIRRVVAELPEEQRQVVLARLDEDKTFAQIAAELSVPLGTVLTRMRMALARLRRTLEDE